PTSLRHSLRRCAGQSRTSLIRSNRPSIAPEKHTRKPARAEREPCGHYSVKDSMVVCGSCDDLLEARLIDFERRARSRDLGAIGKESYVDLVVADRHLCGQRNRGAIELRSEQGNAIGLLPVEEMLALDAQEGEAERVFGRRVGDADTRALQQHQIVEPELSAAQRLAVGNGVKRAVREHGVIGWRV